MAGDRAVAFTESAARRVAAATVAYESGNRNMPPVMFRSVDSDDAIRIGTFSGAWALNASKEVTPFGSSEPISAKNLFYNITAACSSGVQNCAIAQYDGEWYLLTYQCS